MSVSLALNTWSLNLWNNCTDILRKLKILDAIPNKDNTTPLREYN